ncbi:MAG: sensor histidine kinase, partial [Stellaceae bacterium]
MLLVLVTSDPHPAPWYPLMGLAMPSFALMPLLLKGGLPFELLSFASAQLFGAIVLFLVGVFGGLESPLMPWFVAVVMTGCFYFGNRRNLRNPFLICVAAEFTSIYVVSYFDIPMFDALPLPLIDRLGLVSDFCLVIFLSTLTLNFVAVANAQQRELEAEIEIRGLAEARLTSALEEANQAMRSKSTFLANTSHELRTPLNAIIGFADLMRAETFGPLNNVRYRDYLDDIATSGQHLLHIINDILDFSKFEAGTATLDNEETLDLAALIGGVARMIQPQADAARVRLGVEIAQPLPAVIGNERLLNQVMLNLLSNAVKFTPPDGTVTVRAAFPPDGGVAVTVADTGIGMSEEDLKVALTAFGQVDSNLARRFPGTGLGLPLAKAIVE